MKPSPRRPKYKSALVETAIDVVTLRWFLPERLGRKSTAGKLIMVTRDMLPEALPRRYGEYEPFRHKPDGDDYSSFIDLWHEQTINGYGMMFYKCTAPCFGGIVSFSSEKQAEDYPAHTRPYVDIEFQFDGRAFDDPFWCEAIRKWFFAVADKLGAYYAVAYQESGYTTRLNNLSITAGNFTKGEEAGLYPFPGNGRWLGLPPLPTWLSWYGGPYADIARPHIGEPVFTRKAGLGCRMSEKPLGLADLQGREPALPAQYLMTLPGTAAEIIPDDI
jgi:hypothetical protein